MKTHISANEATYGPQQYKTFAGALTAFSQRSVRNWEE
ncbi:hypothetical protein LNTAR_12386 [Lentisphaera araneosa HTCC2155]|uniref:Uncharacterized protein n=1 Tax=Lentisphaera araneosa HTCC2155 TaxID=313628 RepID=A6DJS8_9BACT|nr:hypothetical protein LNTAR_12386 [Lentisphaera araneosa HTCC2155]